MPDALAATRDNHAVKEAVAGAEAEIELKQATQEDVANLLRDLKKWIDVETDVKFNDIKSRYIFSKKR